MASVNPRYLVDAHQMPTDVVVTIEEWRRIVEELEELEEIRAYDVALRDRENGIPLASVAEGIRQRRGL
jgi:DNA-binding IclR family transcriptional regulator